jgi:hypothetical protein
MLIQLNTHLLIEHKLTANQLILLSLLSKQNYSTFSTFLKAFDCKKEFEELVERGYIFGYKPNVPLTYLSVSRKAIAGVLGLGESYFWEFFSRYPMKVNTKKSGVRILHPPDPESKEAQEMKRKYEKVINTKAAHEHVIKCLETELSVRRTGEGFDYMLSMKSYIEQQAWDRYAYHVDKQTPITGDEEHRYGEQLK